MIRGESYEQAKGRRTNIDKATFQGFKTDYFNTSKEEVRPAPQAFLIDQVPNWTLPVHYHTEHQFQVIARGSGTLGRHQLSPFAIHYTSPESGYGPIVSAQDGLSYFTLRAVSDSGAWYLPESRELMKKGLDKKQVTVGAPPLSDDAARMARREAAVETMIEPQGNGLAAWFVRVPPNGRVAAPVAANGAGRFHVVASGTLIADGQRYGSLSSVWVSADESGFEIVAGEDGLEVMVMQYPGEALTYSMAA